MKTFTAKQMEILAVQEEQLRRATYQRYYRSTNTKVLNELKEIYDSVADKPYPANWSCGHCVLSFLAALGTLYFEAKNNQEVKAVAVPEAEVVTKPEPKPKKSTPVKKSTKKATKK